MFESIDKYVQQCTSLDDVEFATLHRAFKMQKVPKKTLLLKEGEICNFESFINKGCIRTYFVDQKGNEITLQLAIEDWWVSDIASFHERKASNMFIETLEDCELLTLTPAAKDKLLRELPKMERVFRLMVQRHISALQNRLFITISDSATDKYLDFIERYPSLPQRVAQHYIASYLGISQEFLSKIRTRLAAGARKDTK